MVRNARYGLAASGPRAVARPVESPATAPVPGAHTIAETRRARHLTAARVYSPRWHIAACWRALQSVVDQLGDPPRYSRYAELAAVREDLPSPPTLTARLGRWSGIAAALAEQHAAREGREPAQASALPRADDDRLASGRRSAAESIGDGRLATQVEVAVLRHLAEHPSSSGTEVRNGAGIRSGSQTWTLLARLEREGLLVNEAGGSGKAWKNAWRLSARGENVLSGLPEGMYV
jgi:hypothetical protein